ncbi:MAG: hypothetical protein Kow0063_33860 [Anaerolineae bacterium]
MASVIFHFMWMWNVYSENRTAYQADWPAGPRWGKVCSTIFILHGAPQGHGDYYGFDLAGWHAYGELLWAAVAGRVNVSFVFSENASHDLKL